MSDAIRLAKRVAETVPCSRAEAERYIAGGWVSVDGAVVEDPAARVADEQDVTLDANATLEEVTPVTLLLHKPAGADAATAAGLLGPATLAADQQGRTRVLRRHFHRLTPAAPLDPEASGLIVYTQDFRVARKLVEEADRVEHEYIVEVAGRIRAGGLEHLNTSLSFRGRPTVPVKVSWQSETRLRIAGKGIKPGQIAFMCGVVGLSAVSVKRLRIGRISLSSLPAGQWRYLREVERF